MDAETQVVSWVWLFLSPSQSSALSSVSFTLTEALSTRWPLETPGLCPPSWATRGWVFLCANSSHRAPRILAELVDSSLISIPKLIPGIRGMKYSYLSGLSWIPFEGGRWDPTWTNGPGMKKGLFLQRKIELLSPEKGRWMLGRQKQYISTMEANHDAVDGWTCFSNSWAARKVYVVMFWRPREMPNITPGWRRIYDKNTPWQNRGCLPQTQQMKPSLTACSLGWTSNSLALGEEKLHRQPAFSP